MTDRRVRIERCRFRLWREWCFFLAVIRHRGISLVILAMVMFIGGGLFVWLEPERQHSLPEAMYFTFSLVFGEPPEDFPQHVVLRALFFIVPLVGLTVILEAIVEVGSMVRDRKRSERSWCKIMSSSMSDHVVLVGFGRLGYRTFKLLRKLGHKVVVIDSDANNAFLDEVREEGSPLLVGDARREQLLEDANIRNARSIILATSDDLANLEIALDARNLAPGIRVVMRMFDQNMADKVGDGFNIHIAMSQASLSAPTFATAAIEPEIVSSSFIDGKLIVMQRWTAHEGGPLCGRTIAQVMTQLGLGIVERKPSKGIDSGSTGPDKSAPSQDDGQGESQLFPPPDTRIGVGDRLIVQGPFEQLARLKETHSP